MIFGCILWLSQVGGHSPLVEAVSLIGPNPISVVEHLLNFGARPNQSPPLVDELPLSVEGSHSCKCTSDREASQTEHPTGGGTQLLQCSFKTDRQKTLESKTDKCCSWGVESDTQVLADETRRKLNETSSVEHKSLGVFAGENQGRSCYTPLHVACAHRSTSDDEDKQVSCSESQTLLSCIGLITSNLVRVQQSIFIKSVHVRTFGGTLP